ncbi:uncharacterized protein LAESUDRAFT_717095 [Laetiporus sulphureus 93-53]|uniref:Uncharacterized protein n=1 Tax=Laetiporus sulphureus 93-53 TaxID=1314785 RepID=A0A165C1W6_9APHY|nr:uncharacterized protein LAESUDRAFT_717095 [Laetiporus sulphureus 93-53]KZT02052.1 hypothetical protein LAESUDRAFT_717095 [Laetiporus sulphureus 93-53]
MKCKMGHSTVAFHSRTEPVLHSTTVIQVLPPQHASRIQHGSTAAPSISITAKSNGGIGVGISDGDQRTALAALRVSLASETETARSVITHTHTSTAPAPTVPPNSQIQINAAALALHLRSQAPFVFRAISCRQSTINRDSGTTSSFVSAISSSQVTRFLQLSIAYQSTLRGRDSIARITPLSAAVTCGTLYLLMVSLVALASPSNRLMVHITAHHAAPKWTLKLTAITAILFSTSCYACRATIVRRRKWHANGAREFSDNEEWTSCTRHMTNIQRKHDSIAVETRIQLQLAGMGAAVCNGTLLRSILMYMIRIDRGNIARRDEALTESSIANEETASGTDEATSDQSAERIHALFSSCQASQPTDYQSQPATAQHTGSHGVQGPSEVTSSRTAARFPSLDVNPRQHGVQKQHIEGGKHAGAPRQMTGANVGIARCIPQSARERVGRVVKLGRERKVGKGLGV